jgi:hypothetical protein
MNLTPLSTQEPAVKESTSEEPTPALDENASPPDSERFDYAMETLERISLGLPTEDENGNPFPPTIRSEAEKDTLRRISQLESELLHTEIQLNLQKVRTNCAKIDATLARARSNRRGGYLEYFFPWL